MARWFGFPRKDCRRHDLCLSVTVTMGSGDISRLSKWHPLTIYGQSLMRDKVTWQSNGVDEASRGGDADLEGGRGLD